VVSVITVNYNGLRYTVNFLNSFREHVLSTEYEMIVIDNGSLQNEADIIFNQFNWVKVIRSEYNLGFAGGNNIGISHATGDYLLFINNDIIISSDFISPLINRFLSNKKIGVVSPKIVNSDRGLCYGGCEPLGRYLIKINYINNKNDPRTNNPSETPLAHGAALMVKKKVITNVGKWPEDYFLYSEEVDWCLQIRKAGYTIWYEPQSVVSHIGSQTTGKDSPLKNYYNTRNRFLLYRRNLKGLTKVVSILYELAIAVPQRCINLVFSKKYALILPNFYGVIDALCNKFGKRRY